MYKTSLTNFSFALGLSGAFAVDPKGKHRGRLWTIELFFLGGIPI